MEHTRPLISHTPSPLLPLYPFTHCAGMVVAVKALFRGRGRLMDRLRDFCRSTLSREHLLAAQQFYAKHGGKTVVLARFFPFLRTFAPFLAGVGAMSYPRFLAFNVVGGVLWVSSTSEAQFFAV